MKNKKYISIGICMMMAISVFVGMVGVASADWPMLDKDPSLNSVSDTSSILTYYGTLWRQDGRNGENMIPGAPVIYGDKVLVFSGTPNAQDDSSNRLYCYNASTGDEIWTKTSSQSKDAFGLAATPAVYDNKVYIAFRSEEGTTPGWGGYVFCYNLSNGDLIWREKVICANMYPSITSLTIYNDNLYVGTVGGYINRIDAQNGGVDWSRRVISKISIGTYASDPGISYVAPTIYDDKIFISDSGGSKKLCCITVIDGSVIWSEVLNTQSYSAPTVYNNNVYVVDNEYAYCYNISTHAKIWENQLSNYEIMTFSSPAIYNGKMFVCQGDSIYCLNATTGNEIWNASGSGADFKFSSPTVVSDGVYAISKSDGKMYCWNLDGDEQWTYLLPGGYSGYGSITSIGDDNRAYTCYQVESEGITHHKIICMQIPEYPLPLDAPTGPSSGNVGIDYVFSFNATTDLQNDNISYMVDWGDGNQTEWFGPYPSGVKPMDKNHTYRCIGDFDVRVMAKDDSIESYGETTEWSDPHIIHMNCIEIDIKDGLGISLNLTNIGTYTKYVDWTIDINSFRNDNHSLFFFDRSYNGSDALIRSGETYTGARTGLFIGLCRATITVTATAGGEYSEKEASCIILGPFVFLT